MQPEVDRDIRSTVVRVAGALVGLAIVLAVIAPFDGVPPRPGTDELAPAQIEVSVLASGPFQLDPTGTVLEPTNFPPPGQRGGPALSVRVTNISPAPLRMRVRLTALSPTLSDAAKVRGSVAGTVVLNGPLGRAAEWSRPSGVLRSGQSSTLRIRFKLLDLPEEAWRGRLDERQIEVDPLRPDGTSINEPPATQPTTEAPPASTSPAPSTPVATTPVPEKLGPPLPGTQTVMGTVMESATANSAQNSKLGPPPTTPGTTP